MDEALFAGVESGLGRALIRFVVAAAVLVLPTTAMGMTLPILARAVTERIGQAGREVGTLYAINIAGAMLGAAGAGFFLIPSFGLTATNLVAVLLDLGLGLAALVAGFLVKPLALPPADVSTQPILRDGSRPIVAILVATGAAAMVLQVLWTRALGTALGPSTYAFSAIVCAYLAGLALGGALAAWVADRVVTARLALALVLLGTGTAAFAGILLVDDLPLLLMRVVLNPELTMGGLVRSEFALAAASVVPATIGMGAIFPLTLSAVVGSDARLGAAVGRAYALNTVGNILGSFAAVFILLPLVGVEWGMRVAGLVYLVVAIALASKLEPSVRPLHRNVVLVGAALVLVAALAWPSWDVSRWTAGMFRMSQTRAFYPNGEFRPSNLIFHRDGLSTTVTVEEEAGVRWIKVNGKIDGSSEGDMPTQVLSGTLPLLFHPGAKQIAVIGCGSCVTVGAALSGNPDHITLIELERQVVEGAKLFESVNRAPWKDPRVTVIEDDGRNYMARQGPQFDVIISEPSNPWMTGAASLFTTEFFSIAARRLQPNGYFLQWLQIYELAPERIASVLKTFQSVFPHVLVFTPHRDSNDLLMLGSREPWRLDWSAIDQRFAALGVEMTRAELRTADDLLALLLFTDAQIRALPTEVPLNRDDNAFIEFGAPRDLLAFAEDDPEVAPIAASRGKRAGMLRELTVADPEAWLTRLPRLARAYLEQGMVADAMAAVSEVIRAADATPAIRSEAEEVGALGQLLQEREDRETAFDLATLKVDPDYARVAQLTELGKEEAALAEFDAKPDLKRKSGAHSLLYGFLLYRQGQYERAYQALEAASQDQGLKDRGPAIAYFMAKDSFEDGQYDRAVAEMRRYRRTLSQRLSQPRARE